MIEKSYIEIINEIMRRIEIMVEIMILIQIMLAIQSLRVRLDCNFNQNFISDRILRWEEFLESIKSYVIIM